MATFPPAPGFYDVLDPANPTNADFVTGGNNWIQWLQQNMIEQWPNLKAAATPAACTPNPQEINQLTGIGTSETIETRLARLEQYTEPVGTIKPWPVKEAIQTIYNPGDNHVPGLGTWHLCNGAALDGNTYLTLWFLLSNTYGGTGQSDMRIPDIQGRLIAGRDQTGANRLTGYRQGVNDGTQGNTGGEEAHAQVLDELRNHDHPNGAVAGGNTTDTGSGATIFVPSNTGGAGSNVAFNVVQPTIIIAYYIRII